MEQIIEQIELYAGERKIAPATVVQYAAQVNSKTWRSWKAGKAFPRMDTVDRIKRYMRENPAERAA